MPLDLVTEIKAGRKIYVCNKSNPRGTLFLALYDMGNRPVQIQIPPTPHPFCLSDVATEFAINEGGSHLRTMLNKKVIRLISEKKARAILSNTDVRAELQAAIESTEMVNAKVKTYRNTREPQSAAMVQSNGLDPLGNPMVSLASGDHVNGGVRFVPEASDSGVNPAVRVIVSQIQTKELSTKDGRLRLSQISDQLVEADLAYINEHTTGQIRDYANTLLAKIRGLDDEDEDEDSDEEDSEEKAEQEPAPAPRRRRSGTLDPSQVPADLRPVSEDADDE